MKDLDLALADVAQDNNISERFYRNSIQDDKGSKRQEIHGETYKRKDDLLKRINVAVGILSLIAAASAIAKSVDVYATVDQYNRVLETKMEQELTEGNINAYNRDHDIPIIDGIKDYQTIQEAKSELKETGNYNTVGDNITDTDKEYQKFDNGSIYTLSNLTEDAIDMVSDQVIDEYKNISVGGARK